MKKLSLVILLCSFSIVVFSQQKNPEKLEREAREDIREGNKLYNQLKFDEAEILYKKALSKNPNYPKASYNLGNTIYQQERNKEAVNQYELVEKTFDKKMEKAKIKKIKKEETKKRRTIKMTKKIKEKIKKMTRVMKRRIKMIKRTRIKSNKSNLDKINCLRSR